MDMPRMVIANGGHLVHVLPPNSNTSLCGHTPRNTAWRMKRRGKWMLLREDADLSSSAFKRCAKCEAKAIKLYPPVEEDM